MPELPTGTVTFLFTDIEGSTRLWEQQPEAMQTALARHNTLLRQTIEEHAGHVFKTIGDGFCAAFNDPAAAVTAAIAAQQTLQAEKQPLRVRMAVHTGAASYHDGDYFGPALNRVSRLLNAGHGGQILLSAATAAQLPPELLAEIELRSLGVHRLRDIAAREAIFQLLAPGLPATFPPLNTLDVAFRRGLRRTAGIASVIVVIVTSLALAALNQAHRAAEGERVLRRHLYVAQVSLAQQAWEGGDLAQARELLEAQEPHAVQEDLRGFEWRYLRRLCDQAMPLHTFPVGGLVAFSPGGRIMASGVDLAVTLWDVPTRRAVATLTGGIIEGYSFSPNGKLLAVGDGPVKLWDVATRRVVRKLKGNPEPVGAVAFSPDGRTLAGAASSAIVENLTGLGEVTVWDVASGRSLATLREPGQRMWNLAFSPDGKALATSCTDGAVKLWSTASWKKVGELKRHTDAVNSIAFSPDGRTLASGGRDWTVKLWDVASRREIGTLQGHRQEVSGVAFSPDGKTLATCGIDKMVKLWDVATQREVRTFEGHAQWVNAVAFSPGGRMLASAGDDGTTKLWDVTRRADQGVLTRQPVGINALSFSADSKRLFVVSGPSFLDSRFGGLTVWDPATGRERAAFGRLEAGIEATAISPDGKTLALALEGGNPQAHEGAAFQFWDVVSGRWIAELNGRSVRYAAAFSPDGKILATGGWDWKANRNTLSLWDVAARREIATLHGHSQVRVVAFSPDGRLLVWNEDDPTISLWDVAGRRRLATIQYGDQVNGVAFSPNGTMLAAGGNDHAVKLWDCRTRREIATLKGHSSMVIAVAFASDGKTLASGGWDGTVKLWNLATMQAAATLIGNRDKVRRLAFSPDGSLLAAGGYDGTVRLWRAARFAEVDVPTSAK